MTLGLPGTVAISFTNVIELATFDTNILIYSIDVRDPRKHEIANRIVGTCMDVGTIVTLQCLNEFYSATTRKGRLMPIEAGKIVQAVRAAMTVWSPREEDTVEAMALHQSHNVPFFDALLSATARRAGCRTLFTEDLQDGRILGGVRFPNPFTPTFDLNELPG